MIKQIRLSVRVPSRLYAKVGACAEIEERTVGEFVREAIRAAIAESIKRSDAEMLACRLGVLPEEGVTKHDNREQETPAP